MLNFLGHLNIVSQLIILRTFVLFLAALFIKGFDHGLLLAAGVLPVKFSDQSPCVPGSSKRRAAAQRADRTADCGTVRRHEISRNQELMGLNFQFPVRGITPATRLNCSSTTKKTNLTI
jgi:hypothetical protein